MRSFSSLSWSVKSSEDFRGYLVPNFVSKSYIIAYTLGGGGLVAKSPDFSGVFGGIRGVIWYLSLR